MRFLLKDSEVLLYVIEKNLNIADALLYNKKIGIFSAGAEHRQVKGNQVQLLSDPVTVNRERGCKAPLDKEFV